MVKIVDGSNTNDWQPCVQRLRGKMFSFACRDMGFDCTYVVYVVDCNGIDEVIELALKHAQAKHPDLLSTPEKMAEIEKSLYRVIQIV